MKDNANEILSTNLLRSRIYEEIVKYQDPYLGTDLVVANCVKDLIIESSQVILNIEFGYLLEQHFKAVKNNLRECLEPLIESLGKKVGINLSLEINVSSNISIHQYNKNLNKVPNIKNIIAIGSGKGGVGKSTVSVNVAAALQLQGAKVGILDADLYGPSLPHMLGCNLKIKVVHNKFTPQYVCGIYCISIANLLEEELPVVWRGPMVSSVLLQLLYNTAWPELDYLIIDLPPGTGDLQLTMAQKIPVTGALIVTTPQDVALLDAQKALLMLKKLQVPVLGIIENMSHFVCDNCKQEYDLFGINGGLKLANKYALRLLGSIPLNLKIREQSDLGVPAVIAFPDSDLSKIYHEIASCSAAQLSKLPLDLNLQNLSGVID